MLTTLLIMLPVFLITGVVVGVLSMLFGIGGGVIIVPAVYLFLEHSGCAGDLAMKVAIGTSLVTIMTSTINVSYKQHRKGNILWGLVGKFLPFVIIGALLGTVVAHFIAGHLLRILFIFFLAFIVIRAHLSKIFKAQYQLSEFEPPSYSILGGMGLLVGLLSILVGIGGSVLTIPFLRGRKMPMVNATAFTVAVSPILALIGAIGYLLSGLHVPNLPPFSLGYINFPAFIGIQVGSFAGAIIGEKLLPHVSDRNQAKWYIVLLIAIILLMLV